MRIALLSVVVLALSILSAPPPANAEESLASVVRIEEISAGGAGGARDGFFELRNTSSQAMDLTGWQVFRCDDEGLRAKASRPEVDLTGVTLAGGQRFTVTHTARRDNVGDARFTQTFDPTGFGLVLIAPSGDVVDSVAVYPNAPVPTQSECGSVPNQPASLAFALDESWQRSSTGWVRARATPGDTNATVADARSLEPVVIDEITAAGPAGHGDDFVELRNTSAAPVDVSGWQVYRCTAQGTASADTLRYTFPADAHLAAAARFVLGGPEFTGVADASADTSLADVASGILLVDSAGRRVDGVWISSQGDSACQTADAKLAADLDYRSGESWQRTDDGAWLRGTRTAGASNVTRSTAAPAVATSTSDGVAISEFANDPLIRGAQRHHFVELANFGTENVDVSGWRVISCGVDGFRSFDDLAVIDARTVLEPGATWLAALRGTSEADSADAVFDTEWDLAGAGAWIEDADGEPIDSVGVYHRNEMDASVDRPSRCSQGLSLETYGVDRLRGETWQRAQFTGDDDADFVAAAATPGRIARAEVRGDDDLATQALAQARAEVTAAGITDPIGRTAALSVGMESGPAAEILSAATGHSSAPLTERTAAGEVAASADLVGLVARDDAYDLPYLRLQVRAQAGEVGWSGRTVGRSSVRLSVWQPVLQRWRTLDEQRGGASAVGADSPSPIALRGAVTADESVEGAVELLVQVVNPEHPAVSASDGLADPHDYDFAISHLTDTQYYTESYPEVYADEVAWIAAHAEERKIAFATHTGDLVQNWVDPDQTEERARREFATASRMQRILEDAGVSTSVLPGNHDNKRGVTNDLFNEYFPPERYADDPAYGGSIAPGDNSANWSSFTAAGASFVMLSLPYAYGDREIEWAKSIIEAHPTSNVVISTHEHLTPKTDEIQAERSTSSRWVSHGDQLWTQVVAPYRNVVLVLSGHFHGVGTIVTKDAGGIAGHTVVESLADYQEFRSHTGERATGFQRLLQFDLASGSLAVDTLSVTLDATSSYPYDYEQFVPDNGHDTTASNERPWNIVDRGLQGRYSAEDDQFAVTLALQHPKAIETDAVTAANR